MSRKTSVILTPYGCNGVRACSHTHTHTLTTHTLTTHTRHTHDTHTHTHTHTRVTDATLTDSVMWTEGATRLVTLPGESRLPVAVLKHAPNLWPWRRSRALTLESQVNAGITDRAAWSPLKWMGDRNGSFKRTCNARPDGFFGVKLCTLWHYEKSFRGWSRP